MNGCFQTMRVERALWALALAATFSIGWPAAPASAETLYLKNGTQVVGRITKEDGESFTVEAQGGRRRLLKRDLEALPVPDPSVALMLGLAVPGAGHLYANRFDRAALFIALAGGGGAAGFFAMRQIRPSSVPTAVVTGVVVAYIIGVVGAFDALGVLQASGGTPRFRIDYDQQ